MDMDRMNMKEYTEDERMRQVMAAMLEARKTIRWAGSVAVDLLQRKYPDSEAGATYRETIICNLAQLPRLVFKYLDAPVLLRPYFFDMRLKERDPEYLGEPFLLDDYYDMATLAKDQLETLEKQEQNDGGQQKQITEDGGGGNSGIMDVSQMEGYRR